MGFNSGFKGLNMQRVTHIKNYLEYAASAVKMSV